MKICLVTAFPPSQGGLGEYGLHIAKELSANPFLDLTILADEIPSGQAELDGFSVLRCWSFDDPANTVRLLRTLWKLKPDVVWFNLLFSTFGRNPLIAFSGLFTPLLARMSGRYTHVTLHHLMDTVDLKDAGVRHARTYRMAGAVATRMLLLSNSVSVLMPGYRKILHEKYGRDNVHLRSHGILAREPEPPDFSRRGNPEHRILAFGKWGTYKRLELMIEAFQLVGEVLPDARLVIGGGDHPQATGYVDSMKKKHSGNPNIEFTGYVHEDGLPDLFQKSSVAVMPYSSSTGCSGVAHLACAYGVPIVCADLPDFRQMADGEELAIEFYQAGNAQDLAACLVRFLTDPAKQEAMASQNFSAALRMTMPTIVQKYLRHFDLARRTEALRHVTRFRRLPGWVPSKPFLLKWMTRNSLGWVRPSGVSRSLSKQKESLLNGNVDGGGKLTVAGIPMNGKGVVAGGSGGILEATFHSPAGSNEHPHAKDRDQSQYLGAPLASALSGESKAGNPDGHQPGEIDWNQLPLLGQIPAVQGSGGDGKNGTGGARLRRNGTD
ncbi:MAG TPA: glycosyltransferase [Terriglobales bacterium]|nr:glycosyltransferase [Terriglobales bacterium]